MYNMVLVSSLANNYKFAKIFLFRVWLGLTSVQSLLKFLNTVWLGLTSEFAQIFVVWLGLTSEFVKLFV